MRTGCFARCQNRASEVSEMRSDKSQCWWDLLWKIDVSSA